jgi:LmbE family N-acetylglucosaminyl deacetylase
VKILVLAPHPDDESIIGLLPLRLKEECRARVWVAPATLGSHVPRQGARRKELQAAVRVLGFEAVSPEKKLTAAGLARLLRGLGPDVLCLPHARDGHATHRAAHLLGVAAMDRVGKKMAVVETEYWHPLQRPNLMVSANRRHLATLQRALRCHAGEVARNDYAARLPAWMSDNVRRGAELVGGAGGAAPDMAYATLYRARLRRAGKWQPLFRGGRIIRTGADLKAFAELLGQPPSRRA